MTPAPGGGGSICGKGSREGAASPKAFWLGGSGDGAGKRAIGPAGQRAACLADAFPATPASWRGIFGAASALGCTNVSPAMSATLVHLVRDTLIIAAVL